MSYNNHMTVTTLVTGEASRTEGVKMMLENCVGIAKGVDHCFDYSVDSVIKLVEDVVDDIQYDHRDTDFSGEYSVVKHGDEVVFLGSVEIQLGNGCSAMMYWESLEHQGKRCLEIVALRRGTIITSKPKRFDPYEEGARSSIAVWLEHVAEAIGQIDED